MYNTKQINQAFSDDGQVIDVTPEMTAGQIVQSMGYEPEEASLVQKTKSGLPKVIRSHERFDPTQGQNIEIHVHGIEG